jgi:hypothetical protein
LDAEWGLLNQHAPTVRTVTGWLLDAGVLEPGVVPLSLDGLRDVLSARDRAEGRAHSDRWLTVLLRRAQEPGSEAALAARVVVQAMLPSAVLTAQRLAVGCAQRADVAQVVVASLWQVVVTYPLARRPARLAANLAWETLHVASREMRRERPGSGRERPGFEGFEPDEELLLEVVDADMGPDRLAERALVSDSAVRLRLVAGPERQQVLGQRGELLDLLVWAVTAGVVGSDAARDLVRLVEEQDLAGGLRRPGVKETARERKRRSRTVQRLRAVAPEFLAHAA